uniref:hypothetical protein n=1 Tax=uncultured Draconibacterium sp. TaxID=1573823 RepID=UPI00321681E2
MSDIFSILYNALTYNGDFILSLINYLVLCILILPFVLTELKLKVRLWWTVLLFSFLLQASFWFILHVQGISIIWNALLGFLLLLLIRLKKQLSVKTQNWIYFSIAVAVLANLYFGRHFPPITSIAHAAAIVLGLFFHLILKIEK